MEDYGKTRDGELKTDHSLEKSGTSLFHHLLNKRILLNSRDDAKSILHRLVFVSKLSWQLADKRDLADLWEQQFQKYNLGESVTGVLLLYSSYTIHIMESSSDVLYCALRDLCEKKKTGVRNLVQEPRILVMSHNIPTRMFSQWSFKVINTPEQNLSGKYNEEPIDDLIKDCLSKLLKLGMHISKYPKGTRNIPDAVFDRAPNLVIPESSIVRLLSCTELLTPKQFLEAYDSPVNLLMDSGHVFGSDKQGMV
ncbi:testis-expressed protein 47-like isoform X2 [Bombina bombina]|uniref:testis-expressed protein 47-like isoform X2 n=1 Tax=Bombina bombina TaxID=8345 RepID=UPI00235A50E0|nr:testis-expressed protein 47-like isoform X2 [Bombina bombina]